MYIVGTTPESPCYEVRKLIAELADALRQLIEQIILTFGYPGVAVVMFLENIFPPVPSEMLMVFTGFLVSEGRLSLSGVIVSGMIGMMTGAVVVYYVGCWLDARVIRVLLRRYERWLMVGERELDRALALMNQHGGWLIVFGRFVPVLRAFIALPAGMAKIPLRKFLVLLTLGSFLYNAVQVGIGILVGDNWSVILALIDQYEGVLIVAGIIAASAGFIVVMLRWRIKNPIDA